VRRINSRDDSRFKPDAPIPSGPPELNGSRCMAECLAVTARRGVR
jgi:hypothetical protein